MGGPRTSTSAMADQGNPNNTEVNMTNDEVKKLPFKILFVDDEEGQRKMFSRLFSGQYHIVTAGSVAEAKNCLDEAKGTFAVLVSDVRMPEQSGFELLSYARDACPDTVRLLVSAYAEQDGKGALSAINEYAVYRYLQKPFDVNLMRNDISSAVDEFIRRSMIGNFASDIDELMVQFRESCEHWITYTYDICAPYSSLDYGLHGILAVYSGYIRKVFSVENTKELITTLEDHVDDILDEHYNMQYSPSIHTPPNNTRH